MAPPHPAPPDPPILRTHDELLDDIFLRLPTPADLARASAACAPFRRLITDHTFLGRYRALHPPPLVGVVDEDAFCPAQPPHPSAVAARAFAGFDFSCKSFLPTNAGRAWRPLDFFDGRVLLGRPAGLEEASECEWDHLQLLELAVCDPVHRRHILLPAVPGDLTALVPQRDLIDMDAFLAPGEDEDDPLSFRVMCLAKFRTHRVLLVSSSSLAGQWHALTFDQWSVPDAFDPYEDDLANRQFVGGCFCWHSHFFNKLVLLDTHSMEFSAVSLPPEQLQCDNFAIVEAAPGMLGMLIVINDGHSRDGPYRLAYSILRNQWHSEKVIPLPEKYDVFPCGVAGGYLLIQAKYTTSSQEIRKSGFFSVDVKTLQVELFSAGFCSGGELYAGFPPSLCAPTI